MWPPSKGENSRGSNCDIGAITVTTALKKQKSVHNTQKLPPYYTLANSQYVPFLGTLFG